MTCPRPHAILAALLLAAPVAACADPGANASAGGDAMAASVAREVGRDCRRAQAPDAAMRRHLERLCVCSETRIAAAPIRFGDSEASINDKVQAAMSACYAELGGAPGEGRR